ncbi:MAG: hypothetical protein ACI8S6_002594 [Myxococcota bacterium]|jgi:hypothetical protein
MKAIFSLLSLVIFGLNSEAHAASADLKQQVEHARVVIVAGSADHMEHVMASTGEAYVVVQASDLVDLPLHNRQVLMVNCRGEMSEAARQRVRRFVSSGGFLYTTDHAVGELIEPTFPGTIRFSGVTTRQEIHPMETVGDRGLVASLGAESASRWQLAGGGYLIDVIDTEAVEVLMRSDAVAAAYPGSSGVLGVRFLHGDGWVIHVSGHFYTQPGQTGDVARAATTFETLSGNVVEQKAADDSRIEALYSRRVRANETLLSAPAAAPAVAPPPRAGAGAGSAAVTLDAESQLRVLEEEGDYVLVRDELGNEGWLSAESVE